MAKKVFDFDKVSKLECKEIKRQRSNRGLDDEENACENLYGLALSGGGIRSASFAIGLLQALHAMGILRKIDYLSTVSGGGYTGSALTWFTHKIDLTSFPFGSKGSGSRTGGGHNDALDFIRQHGNYLEPGKGLNTLSLLAVLLRTSFLSLLVYFPMFCALMGLFQYMDLFRPLSEIAWMHKVNIPKDLLFFGLSAPLVLTMAGLALFFLLGRVLKSAAGIQNVSSKWDSLSANKRVGKPFLYVFLLFALGSLVPLNAVLSKYGGFWDDNFFLWLAMLLIGVFLVMSCLYSLMTIVSTYTNMEALRSYLFRINFQRRMGMLLLLVIGLLVTGLMPTIDGMLNKQVAAWTVAGPSAVLGVLGAFFKFIREQKSKGPSDGIAQKSMVTGAFLLMAYGLLHLAYIVSAWSADMKPYVTGSEHYGIIVGLVVISLFMGLFVNLNYVSIHRMYRDRLAETFLPNRNTVSCSAGCNENREWQPATEANTARLVEMCVDDDRGPYHLINTNIVLVDSDDPRYRGRGGDNFILSPRFCGSYATNWCRTENFMDGMMTLATAMAISGAAINPHTAVAGKGPSRSKAASFLMTMLNLGLGFWAINPSSRWPRIRPNYFFPGLRSLFGFGYDETDDLIQLSDGGHFDNTGLYELIRRKVSVIIISDGSADEECNFDDLANAVEKVRVDFGVHIKFSDSDTDLSHMIPGSAGDGEFKQKYNLAQRGFAIGQIDYPNPSNTENPIKGHIFYIKTILTEGLPADIYGYKSAHRSFPDQPTSDQFFDETQFEAYRELGYQLGKQMLCYDAAHGKLLV